jgi:adenine-specific DNA-methyltransferase
MEKAYESVKKLVEDFRAHERDYLSPNYQESHVRQDFIDKFFTALGWDVTHTRQKNPHEYEVQIENRVQIGSTQQRADYAFFLGPNFRDPKFYVEAKKPARQLHNPDFFYQTMRYGWNGNTPIAILTDFEESYVIDCRAKPTIKDALDGEIRSFHYTDYADEEKFKWIYWLFSHEAVASGSIEKFLATLKKPKGKAVRGVGAPVDEVFLAELDGYRESLAKGFKKSNQELDGEELTEAVQRTIDRLVFIRFLEDKLIEEKEIANLIDRQMAWELFVGYCKKLEPKYNGLIFKPHRIDREDFNPPDEEVFKEICEGLAGRESPYNFAQIPISILGSIYERFLGKVVHATDKRVKVEEKPEVRKAGGVYYTPDYIVRYIVKETVGKLIDGKTPEEISKMAFADIACGSGSFLIEVYDLLLKYHERYYTEHPEKAKKGDTEQREGRKVLSLKKRQEILVNNIYGVDIDYQATEVTQLSLYLKLLEDVTTNDAYQFSLLKEKILPNLSRNIVCGNSLIGRDIAEGNLFPDVEESKLKPMNFEDAFPEVMHQGGFDAVVGNPPYIRMEEFKEIKKYLRERYAVHTERSDIFYYFIEHAIRLLRKNGAIGYIVSNTFTRSGAGENLRGFLLASLSISRIVDFGDFTPFEDASIYPLILVGTKSDVKDKSADFVLQESDPRKTPGKESFQTSFVLDKEALSTKGWVFEESITRKLREKLLRDNKSLGDLFGPVRMGIKTGLNDAFVIGDKIKREILRINPEAKDLIRPYLAGEEMDRWSYKWNHKWLIYTYHGVQISKYDRLLKYLEGFRKALASRATEQKWYELQQPQEAYAKYLDGPKIIYPDLSRYPKFSLDKSGMYFSNTGYFITSDSLYLLGLLNSKLLWFVIRGLSNAMRGGLWRFRLFSGHVEKLPIRTINIDDPIDNDRHDHIVQLVERMLAAKEELCKAKTEAETTRLERECETLDRQIDQAVYELYGLTEEEIKIITSEP